MKIRNEKTGKIEDIRLPKAFKSKWVKALRSGKYEQTTGSLNNSSGYCCLGVACRIVHPRLDLKDRGLISSEYFERLRDIKIPNILKGSPDDNLIIDKLTDINDGNSEKVEKSFKQIAAWIDRNL